MHRFDCEWWQSKCRLDEDVLRVVVFPSLHSKDLSKESLRAVSKKDLFKLCEAFLAVIADEVSQSDVTVKVSETGGKVMFFRVKWACAGTQTSRYGIHTPFFEILLVQRTRLLCCDLMDVVRQLLVRENVLKALFAQSLRRQPLRKILFLNCDDSALVSSVGNSASRGY